jgi:hypothetical protein
MHSSWCVAGWGLAVLLATSGGFLGGAALALGAAQLMQLQVGREWVDHIRWQ